MILNVMHSFRKADSFKDWFISRSMYYLEEGSSVIMSDHSYNSSVTKGPKHAVSQKEYSRITAK